jgi:hypothetical protein
MSRPRRAAERLILGHPGTLVFGRRRRACVVLDVSSLGARVWMMRDRLVPRDVVLELELLDTPLRLPARVVRAEPGLNMQEKPGLVVAVVFSDPEATGLARLIDEIRREDSARALRSTSDRRRLPRQEG